MGIGSTKDLNQSLAGIVPRSFQFIFDEIEKRGFVQNEGFRVKMSFLELYNETLIDLLDIGPLD
jgi:hypothetical protein